jgi:acyl-CoA synthetase (NDP forming)
VIPLAEALFAPKTVALVGASGDPSKNTSRAQRLLELHGYRGRVLPINRTRGEIFGVRAYPDLRAAPGPIDHVFVMVPAAAVPDVIAQCCELQVPVATIFSDGFAEKGDEGRQRQQALVDMARQAQVRLIGPNTMGLMNVHTGAVLSVNAVMGTGRIKPGNISVVSQSGGMLGTLLSRGQSRGLGFSKLVAVGNECDLTVGELVDLLVDDATTATVLLFLETIRDAPRLAAAARRAYAAGKPVVVYMLGRSAYGKQLAESHTGAMTGQDATAGAFLLDHGMLRVEMLETLLEIPLFLAGHKPLKRHRVAVVTGTGGAAATVIDRMGVLGIEVVPPSDRVIANLAQQGIAISNALLTDTTMGASGKGIYRAIVSELLASDHCDIVVPVVGSSAQYQPEIVIERVVNAAPRAKPMAVFLGPTADQAHALLAQAGIASFRTPETCADAIRTYREWRAPAPLAAAAMPERASMLLAQARTHPTDPARLDEHAAGAVFEALGIPRARSQIIREPSAPVGLDFPVAAKVLSSAIAHKSDAGGVTLNIGNAAELAAAARDILAQVAMRRPDARIDGILVQQMERGLVEVILGYRRDVNVGPVVVLGAGGTLAEIYHDIAVRMAPVNMEQALAMIEEVRGLALIRGYRGLPRGDCEALARAVQALSMLAGSDGARVTEAEINPLIVKRHGVVAVDGLIVLEPA